MALCAEVFITLQTPMMMFSISPAFIARLSVYYISQAASYEVVNNLITGYIRQFV